MKVKDLMQRKVFTVDPNDTVDRVFFLLHFEKIRHLPVVDKTKVIGMVSDRDLYKTLGPKGKRGSAVDAEQDGTALHLVPRKVRHFMRRGVITVSPETEVGQAAALMARRRIGALPVVEKNRLVGLITTTDVLCAFAQMTGHGPQSGRKKGGGSKPAARAQEQDQAKGQGQG